MQVNHRVIKMRGGRLHEDGCLLRKCTYKSDRHLTISFWAFSTVYMYVTPLTLNNHRSMYVIPYSVGEIFHKTLALTYFAKKRFTDCIFILATPYRRYSIREYFHTPQQIREVFKKYLPLNIPTIRYSTLLEVPREC